MRISISLLIVLAAAALTAGCHSRPLEKPRTGSLSERVGGHDGIDKIVTAFASEVPKSDQLKQPFADVDMTAFQDNFAAFLCSKIGASCGGTAETTEALYADLSFTNEQYGAFMELFIASMNQADLPQKEQNDLLEAVMELEPKIVKQ